MINIIMLAGGIKRIETGRWFPVTVPKMVSRIKQKNYEKINKKILITPENYKNFAIIIIQFVKSKCVFF